MALSSPSLIFGLCAGGFAGLTWGVFIGLVSRPAQWWELMTAFGTVGATVAAVGIALWQRFVASEERRIEAIIKIGGAYPAFMTLSDDLKRWVPYFEEILIVDRSPSDIKSAASIIRKSYETANLPNPIELIPLGASYARGLALVVSHVDTALRLVETDLLAIRERRIEAAEMVIKAFNASTTNLRKLSEDGYRLITELTHEKGD